MNRTAILLIILLAALTPALAQAPQPSLQQSAQPSSQPSPQQSTPPSPQPSTLLQSRRSSERTNIYRPSPEAYRRFCLRPGQLREAMLGPLAGSFASDSAVPPLAPGNYLLASAREGRLEVRPLAIDALEVHLLPSDGLLLHLADSAGRAVSDAEVRLGRRRIRFDASRQAYFSPRPPRRGAVLEVSRGGVSRFYRLASASPLRRRLALRSVDRSAEVVEPGGSFVALGKPRYRPGDEVHLKALVLDEKGRPATRPLALRLSGGSGRQRVDTLIARLTPYRDGLCETTFRLPASLGLDRTYTLTLGSDGSRPLASAPLRCEDYELASTRLCLTADRRLYGGMTDTIRASFDAFDDNGLRLTEGHLRAALLPVGSGEPSKGVKAWFVADTLWSTTVSLDTLPALRELRIPCSALPAGISLPLRLDAIFLSPDGERADASLTLALSPEERRFEPAVSRGRLEVRQRVGSSPCGGRCRISFLTASGSPTGCEQEADMPASVPIPWGATRVALRSASLADTLTLSSLPGYGAGQAEFELLRRGDSLLLRTCNPASLPAWVTLTADGRTSTRSLFAADSLTLLSTRARISRGAVAISACYLFGNEVRTASARLDICSPDLSLSVITPDTVAPGERATVSLRLTDLQGRPVAGADLTAFAYTAKFGAPRFDALEPTGSYRRASEARLTRPWMAPLSSTRSEPLRYDEWAPLLGLDSIAFYRFLFPAGGLFCESTPDASLAADEALLLPFVVAAGEPQPTLLLLVDDVLHYAEPAAASSPYAFRLKPGRHSVRLVTPRYDVRLAEADLKGGCRTVIAVGADGAPGASIALRDTMRLYTDAQLRLLRSSLVQLSDLGSALRLPASRSELRLPQWVRAGSRLYDLSSSFAARYGRLVGPFPTRFASGGLTDLLALYEADSLLTNFALVPDTRLTLYPGYAFAQGRITLLDGVDARRPASLPLRFDAVPTSAASIGAAHRARLFERMSRMSGPIERQAGPTPQAACRLRLEPGSRRRPVLIGLRDASGALSLHYGGTRLFAPLDAGEAELTLLFADSSAVVERIALRPGGVSVLRLAEAEACADADADKRALALLSRFEELLVRVPLLNPFAADPDSMRLLDAPLAREAVAVEALGTTPGSLRRLKQSTGGAELHTVMMASAPNTLTMADADGGAPDAEAEVEEAQGVTLPVLMADRPERGVRSDFRDEAFWQPRLTTDADGRASFDATYPSDLTAWDAFFLAVAPDMRRTLATRRIRSMLSYSARLSLPRFAVGGDSLVAVGRIDNRTGSALRLTRLLRADGALLEARQLEVGASLSEGLPLVAPRDGADTLRVSYAVAEAGRVTDGEERTLPLVRAGQVRSEGVVAVLRDTLEHRLALPFAAPSATLHAEATPLALFLREIDNACRRTDVSNEQLATSVRMLLVRRDVCRRTGAPFADDRLLRKLVAQLLANRNADGLWGWWGKAPSAEWVSLLVVEALAEAAEAGYRPDADLSRTQHALLSAIERDLESIPALRPEARLAEKERLAARMVALRRAGGEADFDHLMARLQEAVPQQSLVSELSRMRLLALTGQASRIDTAALLRLSARTLLGSRYWEEPAAPSRRFARPERHRLLLTAEAYSLLRLAGAGEAQLAPVFDYFFEARRSGLDWQNGPTSAAILRAILPDVSFAASAGDEPARGKRQPLVAPTAFAEIDGRRVALPYTAEVEGCSVGVANRSDGPLFATLYASAHDASPAPVGDRGFVVATRFETAGGAASASSADASACLKGGEPVVLVAELMLDGAAEYVAVEIPIPAGCSYDERRTAVRSAGEVHRELYRERCVVYCLRLAAGRHEFRLPLLPRYAGSYTLNPARASLLYFPTVYGSEGLKRVRVEVAD